MSDSIVKTENKNNVFIISMNRPDRLNAMYMDLFEQMLQALKEAESAEYRSVIIRGEGKAFSVGGDIRAFSEVAQSGKEIPERGPDLLHEVMMKIRKLEKPVIASIQGACAGAGLSLVLCSDLAIAADNAKFNLAYAGIGLSPDGGSTYFLPRHVGLKNATEILLTGKTMTAEKAKDLGLINRVVKEEELIEQTEQIAMMLAMGPTAAFTKMKKLLYVTFDNTLENQLMLESKYFSQSSMSEDFKEGLTAFLEKRPPMFQGK